MNSHLKSLIDEFVSLEKRINEEIEKKEKDLKFKIEKGKIKFEKEQIEHFNSLKKSLFRYLFESSFLTKLTAPFIYILILPCILLDILVVCYQFIWRNFRKLWI